VIRNVVIHVSNEQPLVADLYGMPSSADVGLVCTNVRTLDGKRPIFIDHVDSTFFFPYLHLRFLEIPAGEVQRHMAHAGTGQGVDIDPGRALAADDAADRYAVMVADDPEPIEPDEPDEPASDADDDLDIDENFLQRIRDI
jgi:hypothetical protein